MSPTSVEPQSYLTFDIEEWFRANYEGLQNQTFHCLPEWVEALVGRFLEICAQSQAKATFFVLGSVAEACPGMVREIAAAGHEIASHSYAHRSVFEMTPAEFAEDLRRSCGILEALSGKPVLGFRAPSFSVTREILPWYYEALQKQGLRYSSSVFPGRTFLYGIPDFPRHVHRPVVNGSEVPITEFPVTRVDLAGQQLGLYVRLFPAFALQWLMDRERRLGRSPVIYLHPREIDPDQPRLPLPPAQAFIHYFGVRTCESKLRRLLARPGAPSRTMAETLDRISASPGTVN